MIQLTQVNGLEETEEITFESLEQEVFKALDHQMRRDILRYVGEGKNLTFTDILNATGTDSPTLSYHLRSLAPFIEQRDGKYGLTSIGKAAYTLLLRTASYNMVALLHKKKYEATVGNSILWVAAIAASVVLKVDTTLTAVILPILAGVSLYITYQLFK